MKALFIGRFQPLHKGHTELIRLISKKYEEIIIGIASTQYVGHENPFTVEERVEMIKEFLKAEGIQNYVMCEIPDLNYYTTNDGQTIIWRAPDLKETSHPDKIVYVSDGLNISKAKEIILPRVTKKISETKIDLIDISVIREETSFRFPPYKRDQFVEWLNHVISRVPKFDVVISNNKVVSSFLREAGCKVESTPIFNRKSYSGKEIRRRIIEDEPWESLVPDQVYKIINDINGEERLRKLSKN